MAKEKPLLHQVKGAADPELFNADLDWYFGCFDYECGLKSLEMMADDERIAGKRQVVNHDAHGQLILVKKSAHVYVRSDPIPYNDRHVSFNSNPHGHQGVFTKGRRIWRRLTSLPWSTQQFLRTYYEARREKPSVREADVREAHRLYLGAFGQHEKAS